MNTYWSCTYKSCEDVEMRLALRYSPRLLERPESTDFIGCFPLRSLRCQQQKNKIVAIVPSKSNNNSSTHWILYGFNSTKNAAAIIIKRYVGQFPQPQTAGSSPAVTAIAESSRWQERHWLTYVNHCRTATFKPLGSKWTAQTIDIIIVCYNAWLSRHASFIYFFFLTGAGSQQIHLSIAVVCCSLLPERKRL